MSKENPLKVSITGIDGSGKSTVTDLVAGQIGQESRVARIAIPTYSVVEGDRRSHYERLLSVVDNLHHFADTTQNKRAVLVTNSLNVVLQGRIVEPSLIRRIHPDLVVGSRDYLIDPSVYAIYYSPTLAKKPMSDRLSIMQDITGLEFRDVIFLLTLPADLAAKRIESRIKHQTPESARHGRMRWPHMHEGAENLDRLRREYGSAMNEVAKRSKAQIFEIDTTQSDQFQVANQVQETIRRFLAERKADEALVPNTA